jgi:hypothetical protein
MRGFVLAVAFVASVAPGARAQSAEDLQGAWRVAAVSPADGGRVLTAPQPGLLLFVGRHYSYTFVTSDTPRPVPAPGIANAEMLLAAWNPFTANAGTFEVSGTSMTRRPLVAKSPATMAEGTFNQYAFRVSADTLWMTPTATETGAIRSASTVRYERMR